MKLLFAVGAAITFMTGSALAAESKSFELRTDVIKYESEDSKNKVTPNAGDEHTEKETKNTLKTVPSTFIIGYHWNNWSTYLGIKKNSGQNFKLHYSIMPGLELG